MAADVGAGHVLWQPVVITCRRERHEKWEHVAFDAATASVVYLAEPEYTPSPKGPKARSTFGRIPAPHHARALPDEHVTLELRGQGLYCAEGAAYVEYQKHIYMNYRLHWLRYDLASMQQTHDIPMHDANGATLLRGRDEKEWFAVTHRNDKGIGLLPFNSAALDRPNAGWTKSAWSVFPPSPRLQAHAVSVNDYGWHFERSGGTSIVGEVVCSASVFAEPALRLTRITPEALAIAAAPPPAPADEEGGSTRPRELEESAVSFYPWGEALDSISILLCGRDCKLVWGDDLSIALPSHTDLTRADPPVWRLHGAPTKFPYEDFIQDQCHAWVPELGTCLLALSAGEEHVTLEVRVRHVTFFAPETAATLRAGRFTLPAFRAEIRTLCYLRWMGASMPIGARDSASALARLADIPVEVFELIVERLWDQYFFGEPLIYG